MSEPAKYPMPSDPYAAMVAMQERIAWLEAQLAIANASPTNQIRLNTDKTVVVDKGYHYRKIDAATQRGGKLQLVNRHAGVAAYGHYNPAYDFWTHFAPLPTFDPKET